MEERVTGVSVVIDESSRVAEARRAAQKIAETEDIAEPGKAAIIATELAANLHKHAARGELHISPLSDRGAPGIEILSIDRGPGMSLSESFVDGFSTTGTAGTGLGAVRRLSDEFDVYSEQGKGTVLVSRILARGSRPSSLMTGLVQRPVAGEEVCGDSWSIRFDGRRTLIMVADGLGHGIMAFEASSAAAAAFQQSPEQSPAALLDTVHRALRGSRGAAVAVASLDYDLGRVQYCGVGNIVGNLVDPTRTWAMVSHNGTVGHQLHRTQEFTYPLTPQSLVVMHSDGLSASWNLMAAPGLIRRDPSLIAAWLYRQAGRDRDDACVIVGRLP